MPRHSWRISFVMLILLIAFQVGVGGVSAQAERKAVLSAPDTTDFPHLALSLDVHDSSGAFVHGLSAQDITLQEGDAQVPVTDLQEQKLGVQFVLAVSQGETFTIRDGMGLSRYDYLLQGLLSGTWSTQSSGVDDFSLLTGAGPQVSHSPDPASIRSSLEVYKPEASAAPGLEELSAALQLASDPLSRPGMERAVLFITPPQPNEVSLGLQSIIASANQQGIRIFVWLMAGSDVFAFPETDLLRNLAQQTGGTFFAFSGTEPVPDLETLLDPLRYVYQLRYDSLVSAPGPQQVTAQVVIDGETITTLPLAFDVDIQAPFPLLLPLPPEIVRSYAATPAASPASAEVDLLPTQQEVTIQVNFPDGHVRTLAHTSLFVDGVLYAENASPPFEQFLWDLRPYTQTGDHTLQVEAVDSLGLSAKTGEATVRISVPTARQNMVVAISQKRFLLVGVVVLLSASVLVLVLILAGRIHPKPHPGQVSSRVGSSEKTRPSGYRERIRQLKDPVTQPVKIASVPPVKTVPAPSRLFARLPWFKPKEKPVPAIAYLLPLAHTSEPTIPASMQLSNDDVTLGCDPLRSTLVIPDPSIEELHATIHHEGGVFTITDTGSVAGTWVNFNQVPPAGMILEHADIIHLGAVGFRFTLAHPGPGRETVIIPLEPGP